MTIVDLCQVFSTDERCRELLERLRWPNGPECLRCKGQNIVRLSTNAKVFWCSECDYQFSVTANTIFHDSHLPLIKWFTAAYLICESRKGMSANQIKRTLGVSYKTAWYLCHRIRAAMATAERLMLSATVEMDETYVGGKPPKGNKRGRGTPKEIVFGIRQQNGELRFFHAADVKSGTLATFVRDNISTDIEVVVTDDYSVYPHVMRKASVKASHKTIKHTSGEYAVGDIHANTVESAFSLLKRGIIGTWRKVSAKHLPAYLEEMTFRFNRRNRSDLFLDTLRHMVTADPLTFERLTA